MAEWVPMSVTSTVLDDILTNLKLEHKGWEGEESRSRIKDIMEYLKEADRKKGRCSDGAKKNEIDEWAEDARNLLHLLEDQIDMSMLPTSHVPVFARLRWNARLAKLVKKVGVVHNRMPVVDGVMPTAREQTPITFADPIFVPSDMIGMENQTNQLMEIMAQGEERMLIFIVGAGGTGKTTFAASTYDKLKARRIFHRCSWVVVSNSSVKVVLRSVLSGFYMYMSDDYPREIDNMDEEKLKHEIRSYCRGGDYLLVLDDVVNGEAWECLRAALPESGCGGRIIFTTRKRRLARAVEDRSKVIVQLKPLSFEDSRNLFRWRVFSHFACCPPELAETVQRIENDILTKCKGNPLSIRIVAAILRTKQATPEAWQDVLQDLDVNLAECQNAGTEGEAADPFVLSGYADLPPHLKSCFLYCSMFPENSDISRKRLIRLWIAAGFVQEIPGKTEEEAAEHQLEQLINRDMLQVVKFGPNHEVMSCRVLGLVRRIALDICDGQNFGSFAPAILMGGRPSNNQAALAGRHRESRHRRRTTPSHHRVLSVHGDAEEITEALTRSFHLRSLLFFGTDKLRRLFRNQFPNLIKVARLSLNIGSYKVLRILELQGVLMEILPEELRFLALLRYLGLRRTGVRRLPKSLGSLRYLETLDVRETNVVEVSDVRRLQKMRHLHLASSFRGRSVNVRKGLIFMMDLQTLAGVKCTSKLLRDLKLLIKLRKLSVSNVDSESAEQLCTCISEMSLLRSLTIKCDRGEAFDLSFLSSSSNNIAWPPLQHLRTLKLGGPMHKLIDWVSSLESITYLYLWDSKLKEDPMEALQSLPNLLLLSLYNAYNGKHLRCNGTGFPKLKKLSLLSLTGLEKWERIESGAMPVLEKLFVGYCPKLKEPPEGLGNIGVLRVVQVAEMPEGFVEMVRKENRNHYYEVMPIPYCQRA